MFKNNKNKGFSLIELIVVIAIMAVMTAVLAPSLLSYVERSRASKDVHTMDEVTNSVMLSLSDPDCYNQVVHYAQKGNVSCYIDTNRESNYEKIITKEAIGSDSAQYIFDDDARLADETPYYAAGNMRGITITFSPDQTSTELTYDLKNGVINQFVGGTDTLESVPDLYNQVRSTIGDTIKLDSQTYRNSDFTIFIKIGTTGGNQSSAQDAIQVYGQYSGTNLVAGEDITYDKASNKQVFTSSLNGNDFEFDEDMTWNDWVNSPYNTEGYKISGSDIISADGKKKISGASKGDKISNSNYSLSNVNTGGGESHSGGAG